MEDNMYGQNLEQNNFNNNMQNSNIMQNSGIQSSKNYPPSTNQSKVQRSNINNNQSGNQAEIGEPSPNEYNVMGSFPQNPQGSFPMGTSGGKNVISKTAIPPNPFDQNKNTNSSELPTLEEKITKSTGEIFK